MTLATERLTALYNNSLQSCRLPSISKTELVNPIPKPGKHSSQGTSYRPISLLCPLSTNFSHQLKINTVSDTQLHLPSSSPPHSVCGLRLDSYCRIVPATRHHSMAVLLPKKTSCKELQRNQVEHENRPHLPP